MAKTTSLASIKSLVRKLAKKHKTRVAFNAAVSKLGKYMGTGAFRTVYKIGSYVVKVRNDPKDCCMDADEIRPSNHDEFKNYKKLATKYPNVAAFVVKPHYVKRGRHDAIIMKCVTVCDHEEYEEPRQLIRGREMRKQLKFIEGAFNDTHENNIGWDMKKKRVFMIDFNYCHDVVDYVGDEHEVKAAKLLAEVS